MFNQKLRLWDSEAKRMIYPKEPYHVKDAGDLHELEYEDYAITLNGNILMKDDADWSHTYRMLSDKYAKPLIIMRSIGLADKNGKDIYEGDILIDRHKDYYEVYFVQQDCMFKLLNIQYKEDLHHGYHKAIYPQNIDYYDFIIKGNKYENPDLLEE